MVKFVRKRDGRVVPFDQEKITNAIFKAAQSVGGDDRDRAVFISNAVVKMIEERYGDWRIPTVEEIQDLVERALIKHGHAKTAKAYILYRDLHNKLRDIRALVDANELVEGYLKHLDWRVQENSNMTFSLQGLNNHIFSAVNSAYWLNTLYPKEIREAHINGDIHLHDLYILAVYCCGWDLRDLLIRGFGGVPGKVDCEPPKHFRSALGQVVNFFYTIQGESAGAVAFSSFDTYLAPFIRYDGLSPKEVRQALQGFIFNMNVPTRVGFQTPFTNITMDLTVPSTLANEHVIIGGEPQEATYGEFQAEMDLLNRTFAELMLKGDARGRVFTFPIPTYNITRDFDWDNPVLDPIWQMTAKYGIPYFANFVNSDLDPEDVRSMCCRLRLDNTELRKRGGGLFGANPLTGSVGVVTLNMARVGYLARDEEDFLRRVADLMDIAKDSLLIKRRVIERFTEGGLYPYSRHYLEDIKAQTGSYWTNHFGTIGLNGMNEAALNLLGVDLTTERGRAFACRVLDFMRERLKRYQEETGQLFNLEATPAEGTSYRFALLDKDRYPDIIAANSGVPGADPYYTNSTQLPVDATDDLFQALDWQDELQTKYTGGTVFHIYLGERLPSIEATKRLVRTVAENYRLPYFTLTPTFSVCPTHGYLAGEHMTCPHCADEQPCEVYSRVVGYLRPVKQWNNGKRAEYAQRRVFALGGGRAPLEEPLAVGEKSVPAILRQGNGRNGDGQEAIDARDGLRDDVAAS
ncbi:MAG: ribonucleoside triphosphate reductase [Chloroflexi bacterium]|nr:ribonucleoside triphosphate reductase [Chloroflexota bacterium]